MIRGLRLLQMRPIFYFAADKTPATTQGKQQQAKPIQVYKDGQLITKNYVQLKKQQDIEGYVLTLVKNYYRTTNKSALTLDSELEQHGLDSLDSIELSMQIEEDLGYVISAETLPVLNKVRHYVNYIKQVEQYKVENNSAPLA
ncbi:unnamed protein product [Paramecium primaurelia]|uniref:Acyl carrier protein n=1 Tax=Paramecium primaurelia TaxID=5886 RepID=A0A8S1PP00_PARPR|nr:unnamed protein product [Paramecium primaurelia]